MVTDIIFEWSKEKNQLLKEKRNISFEEIVTAINNKQVRAVEKNKTRCNQWIYIVELNGYAYAVPFVLKDHNVHFLKTIYPSRKATRYYIHN